jgi:hypothetical protein
VDKVIVCEAAMASVTTLPSHSRLAVALLACAVWWSGPAAAGEANPSLWCIYNMITSAHATMAFCDLRSVLKKFINENARYDASRIGPDYDEKTQERLQETLRRFGRAKLCWGAAFWFAKSVLQGSLTPESVVKIRKRLESPSDPMKGDCL